MQKFMLVDLSIAAWSAVRFAWTIKQLPLTSSQNTERTYRQTLACCAVVLARTVVLCWSTRGNIQKRSCLPARSAPKRFIIRHVWSAICCRTEIRQWRVMSAEKIFLTAVLWWIIVTVTAVCLVGSFRAVSVGKHLDQEVRSRSILEYTQGNDRMGAGFAGRHLLMEVCTLYKCLGLFDHNKILLQKWAFIVVLLYVYKVVNFNMHRKINCWQFLNMWCNCLKSYTYIIPISDYTGCFT